MNKRITMTAFWLLFFVLKINAQIIRYVKQDGTGNGLTWTTASGNLQQVIDASSPNDEVWIAAGVYQPSSGESFSMKSDVAIFGGFAGTEGSKLQRNWKDNLTTLKGNNNVVIRNDGNNLTYSSILDGFTITNGLNSADGGGIYNSWVSPTIINCEFLNNSAVNGGAIYNNNSAPNISNCIFRGNNASGSGGAICNNGNGSNIPNTSPSILYSSFFENVSNISGGAITNRWTNKVSLINSYLSGNISNYGGGVFNQTCAADIVGCVISGNKTSDVAAGIYNYEATTINIINCTVAGNSGEGGSIRNVNSSSNVNIYNTIVYDNNLGLEDVNSTPTISNNLIQDLDNTNPNFINSPLFNTAPFISGNYDLKSNSHAINKGKNEFYASYNASVPNDLSDKTRIYGVIDIGAFEYQGEPTLPVKSEGFTVKLINGIVKIDWRTLNENDNEEFILLRSNDGVNFTEFSRVKGIGNSSKMEYYSVNDQSSFRGITYYKLQQLDKDGELTELGVSFVNWDTFGQFQLVYPNPTYGECNILFNEGVYNQALLLNTDGVLLQYYTINNNAKELVISLADYPTGNYLLRLIGLKESQTVKLIKY
jgi:hypothetical protein